MKIMRPVTAAARRALFVAVLLVAGAPARADLTLDTSFAGDGRQDIDIANRVDSARDVAIQADGRIVAVGLARQFQNPGPVEYAFAGVIRLLADGTLDPGFGNGGRVTVLPGPTPAEELFGGDARAVAVQPDQRILVAGASNDGGGANGQIFVFRLDTAGALDPGFGSAGVALLSLPGFFDPVAEALALQSDGSVIVAGSGDTVSGVAGFLLRLTPAGALDPAFGDNGIRRVTSPDPNSIDFGVRGLVVAAGDAILAVGGGADAFVARFTPAGAPDPGFGTGGFTFVSLGTVTGGTTRAISDAFGLTVQSDGRIVIAGARTDGELRRSEAVLARLTSGGTLDAGFGAGGVVLVPRPTAGSGAAFDVAALANDDLVTAGRGIPVVQVSRNGATQSSRAVANPQSGEFLQGIRRFPDDRVVVAGESRASGTNFLVAVLQSTPLVEPADTTPDGFAFIDTPGTVAPDSQQTSNTVTIAGITAPVPVSVAGGEYRIGGGNFTALAGVIQAGQTVQVRHDASPFAGGRADTTLTVGGVSDTFTSITQGATAQAFDLGDVTNVPLWTFQQSQTITVSLIAPAVSAPISVTGDEDSDPAYSIGCNGQFRSTPTTVTSGQTVCVRHVSSTAGNTVTGTTLVIGGASDTFTSTTVNVDSVPDAFAFAPLAGVPVDTLVTSAPVTVTGIGAGISALVQVENGEVSVGCTGNFVAPFATIGNGQSLCVRQRSAPLGNQSVTTTVSIATVSGAFTSTTGAADLLPDRFDFVDQTGVDLLVPVTSAPVTITGLTGPAEVVVTGEEDTDNGDTVSIGCTATYTATPARITNGQTLCVRHTSSGLSAGAVTTTVRVGGRTATFASTARTADLVPNTFVVPPLTDVGLNDIVESAVVTVTGIDGPAPIEVGPQTGYAIGCREPFRTTPGVIRNGETFCLRTFSPVLDGASVTRAVAIGPTAAPVEVSWTVTAGDTQPAAFDFIDVSNVRQAELVTSQPVTITGITAPALVTIDINGEYAINCREPWTRADGRISNGDTLCVRHPSASFLSEAVDTRVVIGGAWSCTAPLFLTEINGRAVCVNNLGQPQTGQLQRNGGTAASTFTSLTSADSAPGSSAIDPWTLAVLLPFAAWRRRRLSRPAC